MQPPLSSMELVQPNGYGDRSPIGKRREGASSHMRVDLGPIQRRLSHGRACTHNTQGGPSSAYSASRLLFEEPAVCGIAVPASKGEGRPWPPLVAYRSG
jgi:hypothetical protein